jgi:CRP-like cAMP-binding protein
MFGKRKPLDNEQFDALALTLSHISLFAGSTPEQLHRVAELGEEVEAEKGALLVDQGRVGTECFLILEGEAGVYASGEHIATSGPGSLVGEMALVEHRPRNASVIAETPMRLVAFDLKAFKTLLQEMPEVNRKVMATLVERMQDNAGTAPGS